MSIPGQQAADALTSRLGVHVDPDLLVLALTHRSFAYEAGGLPTNERLEFLGDSVLGIVVTDRLYHAHPDLPEGELAKMRAACVSQRALAVVAREIGLGPCILLGKGERATGGNDKDSILCDAFEAILGAVYLTHGMDAARDVVLRLVGPSLIGLTSDVFGLRVAFLVIAALLMVVPAILVPLLVRRVQATA